jgi:hypothetical protein
MNQRCTRENTARAIVAPPFSTAPTRAERRLHTELKALRKRLGKARGAAGGGKKTGPCGAFVSRRDSVPTQAELGFAGDAGKKRLARVRDVGNHRACPKNSVKRAHGHVFTLLFALVKRPGPAKVEDSGARAWIHLCSNLLIVGLRWGEVASPVVAGALRPARAFIGQSDQGELTATIFPSFAIIKIFSTSFGNFGLHNKYPCPSSQ